MPNHIEAGATVQVEPTDPKRRISPAVAIAPDVPTHFAVLHHIRAVADAAHVWRDARPDRRADIQAKLDEMLDITKSVHTAMVEQCDGAKTAALQDADLTDEGQEALALARGREAAWWNVGAGLASEARQSAANGDAQAVVDLLERLIARHEPLCGLLGKPYFTCKFNLEDLIHYIREARARASVAPSEAEKKALDVAATEVATVIAPDATEYYVGPLDNEAVRARVDAAANVFARWVSWRKSRPLSHDPAIVGSYEAEGRQATAALDRSLLDLERLLAESEEYGDAPLDAGDATDDRIANVPPWNEGDMIAASLAALLRGIGDDRLAELRKKSRGGVIAADKMSGVDGQRYWWRKPPGEKSNSQTHRYFRSQIENRAAEEKTEA